MKIIAIEGINGSGKSTLAKELTDKLQSNGIDAILAKLPGDQKISVCADIRSILQDGVFKGQMTKLFLYLSDMCEWYSTLDDDKTYIVDRSYISTMVYQQNDGVPRDFIEHCVKQSGIYVDAAIFLTVDPKIAHARLEARESKTLANYKNQPVEFYKELQEGYHKELYQHSFKTLQVDTSNLTPNQVLEQVYKYVKKTL